LAGESRASARLWRFNRKGTIWYGRLSIRPDLPEEGLDVTGQIEGELPVLVANSLTGLRYPDSGEAGPDARVQLVYE